jgi:hypothetical protein
LFLVVNTFVFGNGGSNVRLLAIYAVTTLVLCGLAYFQRREGRVREGWHYLTPGAMEWLGLFAGIGLTVLFLYVYYFVGSARADAASQMVALKFLIAGFGAGTAAVFLGSFASELRWNDDCIEQHRLWRQPKTIRFADIVGGGMENWSGCVAIEGANGTVIRFSPYQNGAETLSRRIFKPTEPDPSAA